MSAQLPFNILNRLFLGEHFYRTSFNPVVYFLSLVSLLSVFVCFPFPFALTRKTNAFYGDLALFCYNVVSFL